MVKGLGNDFFGLNFKLNKVGNNKDCDHHWASIFEGARPRQIFGIFFVPSFRARHCDNRHMVRAEQVVVVRCRECGAEAEAVYGPPAHVCLVCGHYKDAGGQLAEDY